ncbi:hypothetical protein U9M48_001697 [Paspalum notatum var. saurae]|uniref:Uncharacterized protein n=1 Tax=Paspalum notatum var. saurae TaxID=547442 RepID=A0AAQ3SII0_PASNO
MASADVVPLSVFDKVNYDEFIFYVYAFHPPAPPKAVLEAALAKTLADYREWVGRLGVDASGNPAAIMLNDAGARQCRRSRGSADHGDQRAEPVPELRRRRGAAAGPGHAVPVRLPPSYSASPCTTRSPTGRACRTSWWRGARPLAASCCGPVGVAGDHGAGAALPASGARRGAHIPGGGPDGRTHGAYFRSFVDFASSGAVEEEALVPTADAAEAPVSTGIDVDSLLAIPFAGLDFGCGPPFFFRPGCGRAPVAGAIYVLKSFEGDGSVDAYVPLGRRTMDAFRKCCYSMPPMVANARL